MRTSTRCSRTSKERSGGKGRRLQRKREKIATRNWKNTSSIVRGTAHRIITIDNIDAYIHSYILTCIIQNVHAHIHMYLHTGSNCAAIFKECSVLLLEDLKLMFDNCVSFVCVDHKKLIAQVSPLGTHLLLTLQIYMHILISTLCNLCRRRLFGRMPVMSAP